MKENGVEVHSFFRLSFPSHVNRLNWRNHRKVVVIDGKVGYIGGMNVAERYVSGGALGKWRDTAARITGPCVAALQYHLPLTGSSWATIFCVIRSDLTKLCGMKV